MKRRWIDVDEASSGAGDFEGEDEIEGDDHDEEDWQLRLPSELDSSLNPPRPKRSCHQGWPDEIRPVSAADGKPFLCSKLGHSRTIVHIDLDCFYAQVEMLRNPSLRDKPLGIQQKNIVVTTNYVARARGVSKLSYIKEALIKCPDLVLVSGEDLTNYRETSAKVTEVLEEFCPLVERLGFDENYLDVSQLVEKRLSSGIPNKEPTRVGHSYEENSDNNDQLRQCSCGCSDRLTAGTQIAAELRKALHSRLGLTSCAGVATNKLLAKLIGGHHKPNNQTVLYSESVDRFMGTFSKVRQIPGIGHSAAKKLAEMGITSMQQLREARVSSLTGQFDVQQAEKMIRLAHGVDDTPVVSKGQPQSLSDEDSFKKCSSLSSAKDIMTGFLKNLLRRLRSDGRIPHTMRVTVRKYSPRSWHRESRQTSIPGSIFRKQEDGFLLSQLLNLAVSLFQKLVDTSKPFHLTLINICFTNLRSKVNKGSLDAFLGNPSQKKEESDSRDIYEDGRGACTTRQVQGGILKSTIPFLTKKSLTQEEAAHLRGNEEWGHGVQGGIPKSTTPFSPKTSSGKVGTGVITREDNSETSVLSSTRADNDERVMPRGAFCWKLTTSPEGVGSETTVDYRTAKVAATGQRRLQDTFLMSALSPKKSPSSFFARKTIPHIGSHVSDEQCVTDERSPKKSPKKSLSTFFSRKTIPHVGIHVSNEQCVTDDSIPKGSPKKSTPTFFTRKTIPHKGSHISNEQCVSDERLPHSDDSIASSLRSSMAERTTHISHSCTTEHLSYAVSRASPSRTHDLQTSEEPKSNEMESEIPPDIDRTVFDALPSKMREELLAEWRMTRRMTRRMTIETEKVQERNEMKAKRNEKRPMSSLKSAHGKSKSSSSKHKPPGSQKGRQNTLFRYLKK